MLGSAARLNSCTMTLGGRAGPLDVRKLRQSNSPTMPRRLTRKVMLAFCLAGFAGAGALVSTWIDARDDGRGRIIRTAESDRLAPRVAVNACGRAVIDDWYLDGSIKNVHARRCYAAALTSLKPPCENCGPVADAIRSARRRYFGVQRRHSSVRPAGALARSHSPQ